MIHTRQHGWLSRFRWKHNFYPAPTPLPYTSAFWIATALVALAALTFSAFFILYLTGLHDAYMTHAEDLGIMDQAIWNTIHGQVLHQTICNTVGDTNCVSLNGISRFAIHFEPILFPISLLYLIAPTPKTLVVLQTLVVASGAFPAFWLARLRLRNEWAAAVIALLYLLLPAQQQATIFDFHAVTLTIAFLMFMLYFMYTRRTVWLFVFALLSLACKEEIAGVIVLCGLWTLLLQGRWRSGLALILLAFAWTGLGLFVIHLVSPTGHSLLTDRYTYLGNSPLQIARTILLHPSTMLKQHVLESSHLFYIRTLLSQTGYLALLAPWVLILATPTIALNLLSADKQMYSGLFQYSAEIVPILIFATSEALVLLFWLIRVVQARYVAKQRAMQAPSHGGTPIRQRASSLPSALRVGLLVIALGYVLTTTLRADTARGSLPFSQGFHWPQGSAHVALAQSFINQIPQQASVSAQSSLAPHLSHRANIYLFPYADTVADYVFLDVTSDIYPFYGSSDYIREAKKILLNGSYGIVDAHDGYLLLKKGLPAPGVSSFSAVQPDATADEKLVLPNLPRNFCSYIIPPAQQKIPHPVQVTFQDADDTTPTVELLGFNVNVPSKFSISAGYMTVTTYWRVLTPTVDPLQIALFVTNKSGREYIVSTDVPSLLWCQTHTWKPGMLVRLTSQVFSLRDIGIKAGPASVSLALIPLVEPPDKVADVQIRRPLSVIQAPSTVVPNEATKTLQLTPITLLP